MSGARSDEIIQAAYNGDLHALAGVAASALANSKDSQGASVLHAASAGGHADTLQFLVSKAFLPIDARDSAGRTPLMSACGRGEASAGCAVVLLSHGADASLVDAKGLTPLHHAARGGSTRAIEAILKVTAMAIANASHEDGGLPIHHAAAGGSLPALKALHNAGSSLQAVNKKGMQPIHFAAGLGRHEVVSFLLQEGGSDVAQATDALGRTALHIAAGSCRQPGTDFATLHLLQGGASPTAKDSKGNTPADVAGMAMTSKALAGLPRPAADCSRALALALCPGGELKAIEHASVQAALSSLPREESARLRPAGSPHGSGFLPEIVQQVASLARAIRSQWLIKGACQVPPTPAQVRPIDDPEELRRLLAARATDHHLVAAHPPDDEDLLGLGGGTQAATTGPDLSAAERDVQEVVQGRAVAVQWTMPKAGAPGFNPGTPRAKSFLISHGSKWTLAAWTEVKVSSTRCLVRDTGLHGGSASAAAGQASELGTPFRLQPASLGAGSGAEELTATANQHTFLEIVRGFEPGASFSLRVKACSTAGASGWSGHVDFETHAAKTPAPPSPAAPAQRTASSAPESEAPKTPLRGTTSPSRVGAGSSSAGAGETPVQPVAADTPQLSEAACEAASSGDVSALVELDLRGSLLRGPTPSKSPTSVSGDGAAFHTPPRLSSGRAISTPGTGATSAPQLQDPNVLHALDAKGRCLLHHAAKGGSLPAVRWMVQQASAAVHCEDTVGATPLLLAVVTGSLPVVKFLRRHGAALDVADAKGFGTLHYAVLKRKWTMVRWLLEQGLDPRVKTKSGATPAGMLRRDKALNPSLMEMVLKWMHARLAPLSPLPPSLLDTSRFSLAVQVQLPQLQPGMFAPTAVHINHSSKFSLVWSDVHTSAALAWSDIPSGSDGYAPPDGAVDLPRGGMSLIKRSAAPTFAVISQLKPNSSYTVRARAAWEGSSGPWSETSDTFVTRASDDRHVFSESHLQAQVSQAALPEDEASGESAPADVTEADAVTGKDSVSPQTTEEGWRQALEAAAKCGDAPDAIQESVAAAIDAGDAGFALQCFNAALASGHVGVCIAMLGGATTTRQAVAAWQKLAEAGLAPQEADAAAHPVVLACTRALPRACFSLALLCTLDVEQVVDVPLDSALASTSSLELAFEDALVPSGTPELPGGATLAHLASLHGAASVLEVLRALPWSKPLLSQPDATGALPAMYLARGVCRDPSQINAAVGSLPLADVLRSLGPAVLAGNAVFVSAALAACPDLAMARQALIADETGVSLLHVAQRAGFPEVVQAIVGGLQTLEAGAASRS